MPLDARSPLPHTWRCTQTGAGRTAIRHRESGMFREAAYSAISGKEVTRYLRPPADADRARRQVHGHAALCGRYSQERRAPRILQGLVRPVSSHLSLSTQLSSSPLPPPRPTSSLLPFRHRVHATQGTLTPLLGIGVCVSIQFGALEYSKRLFAAQNVRNGRGGPDGAALGSGQLFVAGMFAGVANGVVSGPVEHIRIRE